MNNAKPKEKILRSGNYAHLVRNGAIVDSIDYKGESMLVLRRIFAERANARHELVPKLEELKSLFLSIQNLVTA